MLAKILDRKYSTASVYRPSFGESHFSAASDASKRIGDFSSDVLFISAQDIPYMSIEEWCIKILTNKKEIAERK